MRFQAGDIIADVKRNFTFRKEPPPPPHPDFYRKNLYTINLMLASHLIKHLYKILSSKCFKFEKIVNGSTNDNVDNIFLSPAI